MNPGSSHPWHSAGIPVIEPDYLAEVLGAACDIALVVTGEGVVASVLASDETDSRSVIHWQSTRLQDSLTIESLPKFQAVLDAFRDGAPMPRTVELNHLDDDDGQFPVRYATYRISGDDLFLMLGQDLRHVAAAQQHLVQAQIALEREHEERRDVDTRYRLLMGSARDAFVVIAAADGQIHDLNVSAANILGGAPDQLLGARLADHLDDHPHSNSTDWAADLLSMTRLAQSAALMVNAARTGQQLLLTRAPFRATGVPMLLCRLEPDEASPPRDRLDDRLRALVHTGLDGIVMTDTQGLISWANDPFVDMIGAQHLSDLTGRSLAGYLSRGALDLEVLIEATVEAGRLSSYTTWLTDARGGRRAVDICATMLPEGPGATLGIVIRDVTSKSGPHHAAADPGASGAARLVGQAPLKEIVAATTDVIEKICIETALDLTRNNRAAAAEMLGLSRQSLYIKLRKLGLIDTKDDS